MERIYETNKTQENRTDSPTNKWDFEVVTKEAADTNVGLKGFFIMEDRTLMRKWMNPYTEWLLMGGLSVIVGILLWGYLYLEETVWVYVWAFGCCIELFLVYALCQSWIQRASWNDLNEQKMLLKGATEYLSKQDPVEVIYQIGSNDKNTWVFEDIKRSFIYVSQDWIYLFRLLKFEKPIFRDGGWYVMAEPRQRVIHLVDFCRVPETQQAEAYCLQRFVDYLKQARGYEARNLLWKRIGNSIQMLCESPEVQGGCRCFWAKGPDQTDWLFITDDERWHLFVQLWNRVC